MNVLDRMPRHSPRMFSSIKMDSFGSGMEQSDTMLDLVPSGYVRIAIEHGPLIVDVPIKNGDFP